MSTKKLFIAFSLCIWNMSALWGQETMHTICVLCVLPIRIYNRKLLSVKHSESKVEGIIDNIKYMYKCYSIQFSHTVVSNSLRPHGLQHTRLPCSSTTPRACSNSCPLSWWCHPTISSSVVPFSSYLVFPRIRVFSSLSVLCIRWPKYWSFSFSISPSNEYSGLISFWIDWLDLLVVQGTLKNLLQHHSSKASVWCSAFFMVEFSHPYMTTGKTIALTIWTFVGSVMSLFSNTLSTFVIAFLPRIKCLWISWLQSPDAVILEPKEIKSSSFHFSSIYLPWSDWTRSHDLRFLSVEL